MPEENGHWPQTVEAAVKLLLASMSKEAKEALRRAVGEHLSVVNATLVLRSRNALGLWRGKTALLEACADVAMHPDEASLVILREAISECSR